MKMSRKLLAFVLTVTMVTTMMPSMAFAAGTSDSGQDSSATGGTVIINENNFPDKVFREYVKTLPGGSDNKFTPEEISNITDISCGRIIGDTESEKIESIKGVELLTSVSYIDIRGNNVKKIDVSGLPRLYFLHCAGNDLTEINTSANGRLTVLYCSYNKIKELDLSGNPELRSLACEKNGMTSLKFAPGNDLRDIDCAENKIESLDLSANPGVEKLMCYKNNISTLKLAEQSAMKEIQAYNNNISELKLDGCKSLTNVSCYNNRISRLNVKNSPSLVDFDCCNNNLSELDISENRELKFLECEDNNIAALNTENNKKLISIRCSNNNIPELNISGAADLMDLRCNNNRITELDLQNALKLKNLQCSGNNIKSLDISNCPVLDDLECSNNSLTELDISKNPELRFVEAICNNITDIQIPEENNLYNIYYAPKNIKMSSAENFSLYEVNTLRDFIRAEAWGNEDDKCLMETENLTFNKDEMTVTLNEGAETGKIILKDKESGEEMYVHNFSLKEADYSKVDEAIKNIPPYSEDYTGESVRAVEAALAHVIRDLTVRNQAEVDKMAEDIENAVAGLVLKEKIADITFDSSFARVNDSTFKYIADGNTVKADPVVKNSEGTILEEGKDYTVEYSETQMNYPGEYNITLKGKGNYRGTEVIKLVITPEAVDGIKVRCTTSEGGYDDAYVTWSASEGADGYQVYARRPSKTENWTYLGRTTERSFLEKDLYDGWKYEFKVIPYKLSDGTRFRTTSGYSTVTMYIMKKVPTPSVKRYSSSRVQITWKNISGESGYQVMASRSGKTTYFRTSGTSMKLSVSKGKKYTYKVRAYRNITRSGKTYRVYAPWSEGRTYTLR